MDKVICLGKNYPDHAAELGETQPEVPVLFLKPPSALLDLGVDSPNSRHEEVEGILPLAPGLIHHELEVVFRVHADGSGFDGFTLGLDLTRRDLQANLKKNGHPWEIAKVFPCSAVIGGIRPMTELKKFRSNPFELYVNGELRQRGNLGDMLVHPERGLELARSYFPICGGDLLFTGTPPGVGPIQRGDKIRAPGFFALTAV